MKYLDFYNRAIQAGEMMDDFGDPVGGMCDYFSKHDRYFNMVSPTESDFHEIDQESKSSWVWGSDSHEHKFYEFTPLRQNVVLLMAAMAGEL